jgi:PAS domain S-box-containing protein
MKERAATKWKSRIAARPEWAIVALVALLGFSSCALVIALDYRAEKAALERRIQSLLETGRQSLPGLLSRTGNDSKVLRGFIAHEGVVEAMLTSADGEGKLAIKKNPARKGGGMFLSAAAPLRTYSVALPPSEGMKPRYRELSLAIDPALALGEFRRRSMVLVLVTLAAVAAISGVLVAFFRWYHVRPLRSLGEDLSGINPAAPGGRRLQVPRGHERTGVGSLVYAIERFLEQLEDELERLHEDIERRRRTKAILQENERKYRLLADNVRDVVWTLDTDGNFTYITPSIEALSGFTPSEALERNLYKTLTSRSYKRVEEALQTILAGCESPQTVQVEYLCKDGSTALAEIVAGSLRDGSGRTIGVIGCSRDTASRMEQFKALMESEGRYRPAFEEARAGAALISTDGVFIEVNRRFGEMIGCVPEELEGTALENVTLAGPGENNWLPATDNANDAGGAIDFEADLASGEGRKLHVQAGASLVRDEDGNPCFYVLHVQDITARQQSLDALRKSNTQLWERLNDRTQLLQARVADLKRAGRELRAVRRARGDFLAKMSHRLSEPLHAVFGYTDLMQRNPLMSRDQLMNVEAIDRNARRMLALLEDVNELSRLEAGKGKLTVGTVKIHPLLEEIRLSCAERAAQKGLQFGVEAAENLPPALRTDEGKLRRILNTLLDAAMNSTPRGDIVLRVRLRPAGPGYPSSPDSGAEAPRHKGRPAALRFEIEDTGGGGLTPGETETLFDAFSLARTTRSAKSDTGLELAIARRYVMLLGGRISADSEPERGFVFRFNVPLQFKPPSQR